MKINSYGYESPLGAPGLSQHQQDHRKSHMIGLSQESRWEDSAYGAVEGKYKSLRGRGDGFWFGCTSKCREGWRRRWWTRTCHAARWPSSTSLSEHVCCKSRDNLVTVIFIWLTLLFPVLIFPSWFRNCTNRSTWWHRARSMMRIFKAMQGVLVDH